MSPSARLVAAVACLTLPGCLGGCSKTGPQGTAFDRTALLAHYADNLIAPAYAACGDALDELSSAYTAFAPAPEAAGLTAVREAFVKAWLAWQEAAFYDFGPAADAAIRGRTNTFPTDTARIEEWVVAGSWDLDAASAADARGFPALDFLLFAGDEEDLLEGFATAPNAADRLSLLGDLIASMAADLEGVTHAWEDGYRQAFVDADGTDAGSSLGLLVNALNRYYEADLRDGKIGIPLGVRTLGIPVPEKVESRYSGRSLELARTGLAAYGPLLTGGSGTGLDDYLDAVDARYDDRLLSAEIADRLESASSALDLVPAPLAEAVVANPQPVEDAYAAMQTLLVTLKVDMPSALGILITYQDNDGD